VTVRPPATGGNSHDPCPGRPRSGHDPRGQPWAEGRCPARALSAGVTHDLYAPIQSQVLLPVHLEPRDLSHPRHALSMKKGRWSSRSV